jgi:glycosyltransferase involved in cell wall biosynthesis
VDKLDEDRMLSNLKPTVSAITIVCDGERYLSEAIESVLSQSFHDWELIVVDDGSTDNSAAIASRYARLHPEKIRAIAHPDRANHGMAAARNLGVAESRGRYIGFLDADDIWMPTKLQEQVAILETNDEIGLVYGQSLIWYSWSSGAKIKDFFWPLGVAPNAAYPPPKLFELLLRNKSQSPTTCNALMRASLVERVRGFDSRFKGMFEDQTFFARALVSTSAYVSDRHWANYRQHDESCSAKSARKGQDARARLTFLSWLAWTTMGTKMEWRLRLVTLRTLFEEGQFFAIRSLIRLLRPR